jgi:CBS domain-containing protein
MLKVKEVMRTNVVSITPRTEILHAAKLLLRKGINGVPVVDEKEKYPWLEKTIKK